MKTFCFVLLCIFLWGCDSKDTIISLQFKNAEGKKVFILKPQNHLFLGITDTILSVKKDSVYKFPVRLNHIVPMQFRIENHTVHLLLQPGQSLSVVYDLKDRNCQIQGKGEKGLMLYNELAQNKNRYKYEWIKTPIQMPLDSIPEKTDNYFRTLEARELSGFDSLLQQGQISQELNDFIRKDIHLYYSMTLSKIARGMEELVNPEAYKQYGEQLYRENPFQEDEIYSEWFYPYTDIYFTKLLFKNADDSIFNVPQLIYEYRYNQYNQHLSSPAIKEVLLAQMLYIQALNNATSSLEIISYFEKFRQQFPESPHYTIFQPFVQKLKAWEEITKQDFSPDVHFIEGYSELKTLNELLEKFKGKPVFIDFWFSTCGPCKEEFSYIKPLKAFLKEQQIEMLYISVDRADMEENWKNNIKNFNLSGWHARTSQELHVNIAEQYSIYSFPSYMLINKEGQIVLPRTKRPSEKEALYKQIREALE